jgi:nitrogen regulatory protein PII
MKMITAVIKPFKLDEVRDALRQIGCTGFTTFEAKGFGRQKGQTEIFRGDEYVVNFLPKTALVIAVDDDKVDDVVQAILRAASTGRHGDGRIFVVQAEQVWNIRTVRNEAQVGEIEEV